MSISLLQRLNVIYDDGTSKVVTSDRAQMILGDAIDTALSSAERYGAELHFGAKMEDIFSEKTEVVENISSSDIVALFSGAHTSQIFPHLDEELGTLSWPEFSSSCQIWLRIKNSVKKEDNCTRGGGIGAENWHYFIESARDTVQDVYRVRDNLVSQHDCAQTGGKGTASDDEAESRF